MSPMDGDGGAGGGAGSGTPTETPTSGGDKQSSNSASSQTDKGANNSGTNTGALDFSDIDNNDDLFSHQKERLKQERIEKHQKSLKKSSAKEAQASTGEEELTDGEKSKEAGEKPPTSSVSKDTDKVTLKVDGKDVETTLGELKKSYGLTQVANARLKEAATAMKQVEQVKGQAEFVLKSIAEANPEQMDDLLLRVLGPAKSQQLLESMLKKRIDWITMDDSKREILIKDRELERYRQQEQQAKEEQARRNGEEAHKQLVGKFSQLRDMALTESGLPNTQIVQQHIVTAFRILSDKGFSPEQIAEKMKTVVVPYVRNSFQKELEQFFSLPPEEQEKIGGAKLKEKWLNHFNSQYDNGKLPPSMSGVDARKPAPKAKEKPQFSSREEWSKWKDEQLRLEEEE